MRHQGHSRGLVAAIGIAALCGVCNAGSAFARGKLKARPTAVFLITSGAPNPGVVQAVARALPAVTARARHLKLVTGMELRRRIGKQPTKALDACGADFRCLAKLGAKADATRMVIVRVSPGDAGTRIQFVVINVTSQVMSARIEVELATAAEVEPNLERNFFNIFGVPLPQAEKPAVARAQPAVGKAGAGSTPGATADGTVAAADPQKGPTPDRADAPGPTPDAAGAIAAGPAPTSDLALVLPELEAVAPRPVEQPAIAADYVMYAGFGLLGAGIVAIAVGGVFGANGQTTFGAITNDVSQNDAIRRRNEAWGQLDTANILYVVGGATAGIGAVMVLLGLIEPSWLGGGAAKSAATGGGAQSSLRWSW